MELPLDYVSNTGSSFHVLKIVLFAYLCLFMLIYGDLCLFTFNFISEEAPDRPPDRPTDRPPDRLTARHFD